MRRDRYTSLLLAALVIGLFVVVSTPLWAGVYTSGMVGGSFTGGTVPNATTFTSGVTLNGGITAGGSSAIDFSGDSGTFKFPTGGINANVACSGTPQFGTLAAPCGTYFTSTIDSGTGNNIGITARLANGTDPIGNNSGAISVGTLTLSAVGMKALSFSTGGQILGMVTTSGDPSYPALYSRQMTADTNGTTINKLVVYSSSLKVQIPAATANLKTVAGVALGTRTSGQSVNVARLGPVLIGCDAGVVAGDMVASSGTTAGNVVTNNSPASPGIIVGKAMEATGNTVASQCYVDVDLQ